MPTNVPTNVSARAPTAVRLALQKQLVSVVSFLDDQELSDLLDLAVARFIDPPLSPVVAGVDVQRVDAQLVARHGWVLGIVVRQATPLAIAWRWWSGTASGTALSEADAVACVAAKS